MAKCNVLALSVLGQGLDPILLTPPIHLTRVWEFAISGVDESTASSGFRTVLLVRRVMSNPLRDADEFTRMDTRNCFGGSVPDIVGEVGGQPEADVAATQTTPATGGSALASGKGPVVTNRAARIRSGTKTWTARLFKQALLSYD